jgi:hypothetical protein
MNITLKAPWTYRTPLATVTYPGGTHTVAQPIADAARADGALIEEEADGQGIYTSKTRRKARL